MPRNTNDGDRRYRAIHDTRCDRVDCRFCNTLRVETFCTILSNTDFGEKHCPFYINKKTGERSYK